MRRPGPFGVGERGTAAHEAALALLGIDPPVLAQGSQCPDDRGPGDTELGDKLVFRRQQRPGRIDAALDPLFDLRDDLRVLRWRVVGCHAACPDPGLLTYQVRLARLPRIVTPGNGVSAVRVGPWWCGGTRRRGPGGGTAPGHPGGSTRIASSLPI